MTPERQAKFDALKKMLAQAKFNDVTYIDAINIINSIQFVQTLESEAKEPPPQPALTPNEPKPTKTQK